MSTTTKTVNIKDAVRAYFHPPEWATFFEVHSSTGFATRSADAIAMSLYPSRGLELYGLEFKASRADWLRELKTPEKADEICQQCDRWAIVTSDTNVLKEDELPEHWGWYVCSRDSLRVKKRPQLNPHRKPLSRELLAALLRRASEAILAAPTAAQHEIEQARQQGYDAGARAVREEANEAHQKFRKLVNKVRVFECEAGVMIDSDRHWHNGMSAVEYKGMLDLLRGNEISGFVNRLNLWKEKAMKELTLVSENLSQDMSQRVETLLRLSDERPTLPNVSDVMMQEEE